MLTSRLTCRSNTEKTSCATPELPVFLTVFPVSCSPDPIIGWSPITWRCHVISRVCWYQQNVEDLVLGKTYQISKTATND
ncbi:hypothetical protein Q7C36_023291 [Tachysurus vachellii]|uniref:Uncharacterized protein n=1 Tax=Tachysurus vachellii TaxID=175792 RepID=A0AA88LN96_TACVA|nr:hypothetical protein Q7C36_023291 [Tachysurus vachellii]